MGAAVGAVMVAGSWAPGSDGEQAMAGRLSQLPATAITCFSFLSLYPPSSFSFFFNRNTPCLHSFAAGGASGGPGGAQESGEHVRSGCQPRDSRAVYAEVALLVRLADGALLGVSADPFRKGARIITC